MNGISDLVVSWRAIWLASQAFRSSQLVENSFRPIANFENYWRTRSKYATSFLRTCSEFGNRVLWLAVISNSQSKLIEMRFDWLIFLQPIITRILKISLYFITSLIRSIKWCTPHRTVHHFMPTRRYRFYPLEYYIICPNMIDHDWVYIKWTNHNSLFMVSTPLSQ